jgi:hypothetical protein
VSKRIRKAVLVEEAYYLRNVNPVGGLNRIFSATGEEFGIAESTALLQESLGISQGDLVILERRGPYWKVIKEKKR